MKIKHLSKRFAVSSQIHVKQIQALVDAGFTLIINNRPDGEMWGQPKAADIEAAILAAGMKYISIPISLRGGLDMKQVEQTKAAQKTTPDKILAFCNSGTRAANIWALSQAGTLPADDIIKAGMSAGYNLSGLRPYLDG